VEGGREGGREGRRTLQEGGDGRHFPVEGTSAASRGAAETLSGGGGGGGEGMAARERVREGGREGGINMLFA